MKSLCLTLAFAMLLLASPERASADRNYVIRSGDTLARLARRFHTSISAIRRANRLRSDNLRAGGRLTIPSRSRNTGRRASQAARRAGRHLVRSGDSLSVIARRYHVQVSELRRVNRLRSDRIRPGMRLRIPGRRQENRAPRVAAIAAVPTAEGTEERVRALGLGSRRAARILLGGDPEMGWITAAQSAPHAVPETAQALDDNPPLPETEAGTLRHPLTGEERHFMRGWGSGSGGYHLALDLYAPPGSQIRAAARGLVAYAGTGVTGYGRFVIIVHPDGRVTAYAHNRQMFVHAGDLVAQGQVISHLGNTGLSRGPHLHFMLIDHGEHCDPAPLLRPLPARRNGDVVPEAPLVWREGERPAEVRCLPRNARPHPGLRPRRPRPPR